MWTVSCPYQLSAGATGVGLVVLGVGLLVVAQIRAERSGLADQLERLREPVRREVGLERTEVMPSRAHDE